MSDSLEEDVQVKMKILPIGNFPLKNDDVQK